MFEEELKGFDPAMIIPDKVEEQKVPIKQATLKRTATLADNLKKQVTQALESNTKATDKKEEYEPLSFDVVDDIVGKSFESCFDI